MKNTNITSAKQNLIENKLFDEHIVEALCHAEEFLELTSFQDGFSAIRPLGMEDFGNILWNMPSAGLPKLSTVLPKMTADEVTTQWTGCSGFALLQQSVGFVRSCAENYASITDSSLRGKRMLDFGCGYGRFLRLFSYYTDDIFGVDAWEVSLVHSRDAGFADKVFKSDEVPNSFPFKEPFDFLFSFSVFTHLSEKATIASLNALRGAAKTGAVLAITIRPIEFWTMSSQGKTHLKTSLSETNKLIEEHRQTGFAYIPMSSTNNGDECHYGDTSMTLSWLLNRAPGWEYHGADRSLSDSQQLYIFLRAV